RESEPGCDLGEGSEERDQDDEQQPSDADGDEKEVARPTVGEGHLLLVVGAEAGDDVLRERQLEGPSRGEPGEKPGEADSEAKGGERDGHLRWHGSWSVQRERSEHRKRDDDPTQQDGESKSDQRREEGDDGRLDEEETPDAADGDAAGPQYREFSPPTREAQIESHSAEGRNEAPPVIALPDVAL